MYSFHLVEPVIIEQFINTATALEGTPEGKLVTVNKILIITHMANAT
jgi:hypothetical protein